MHVIVHLLQNPLVQLHLRVPERVLTCQNHSSLMVGGQSGWDLDLRREGGTRSEVRVHPHPEKHQQKQDRIHYRQKQEPRHQYLCIGTIEFCC